MVRGMNSAEMQKNNRTLVFKLLQERGMITRAEIAKVELFMPFLYLWSFSLQLLIQTFLQ